MNSQKLILLLTVFLFAVSCELSSDEDSTPTDDIKNDQELSSVTLLLDSACISTGNIPASTSRITFSSPQSKVYLIKGEQRLIKIEPDTAIVEGFYFQVDGQNEYTCLASDDGFVELGAEEEGTFQGTICAYDANQSVLGCVALNFEVQEPVKDIFCSDEISEKTWDWKYSIFNNNLFDYPYFNPTRPIQITGYCRTSEGTIENELTLEEEGWTNFVHLIMKKDQSFTWISNWYTKHWDIITTDCYQVGYDTDTIEEVFEGKYIFNPDAPTLDLQFEKQHPEEGMHNIALTCNILRITRFVTGTDGGEDAGFTMVFEKRDD